MNDVIQSLYMHDVCDLNPLTATPDVTQVYLYVATTQHTSRPGNRRKDVSYRDEARSHQLCNILVDVLQSATRALHFIHCSLRLFIPPVMWAA